MLIRELEQSGERKALKWVTNHILLAPKHAS